MLIFLVLLHIDGTYQLARENVADVTELSFDRGWNRVGQSEFEGETVLAHFEDQMIAICNYI